jgi:hypothetical protein
VRRRSGLDAPSGHRSLWLAGLLALATGPGPCTAEDTLLLKGGRRIEVESWWVEGEVLVYRKYGGTVGIPHASVVEVLEGNDGSDRLGQPPVGLVGYPGSTPPRPQPAAPPLIDPAGDGAAAANSDRWEAELALLEERLRLHPHERAALHDRMARIRTQMGNERYHSDDLLGAIDSYETAVELSPTLRIARLNLASAYLSAGRNAQALRQADITLEANPDDAEALSLKGEALYRAEQLGGAIRAWTRAQKAAPSQALTERLDKARREREVGADYQRSDGAHFTVRYDSEQADTAVGKQIVDYLENEFDRLVARYNHLPPAVIVVVLYPTRQFHEVTGTPEWTGGLFDGKVRVPIGGLRQLTADLQRVLTHELTHSFVTSKSRGSASRWMQEGLAQLEEGKTVAAGTIRALARQYRLEPSRWGDELDYPSSLALVRFLIDRYGFGSLADILEREGQGLTESEAFRRVLGIGTDEVFREWGEALTRGEMS